jgi:hypothetical protein
MYFGGGEPIGGLRSVPEEFIVRHTPTYVTASCFYNRKRGCLANFLQVWLTMNNALSSYRKVRWVQIYGFELFSDTLTGFFALPASSLGLAATTTANPPTPRVSSSICGKPLKHPVTDDAWRVVMQRCVECSSLETRLPDFGCTHPSNPARP